MVFLTARSMRKWTTVVGGFLLTVPIGMGRYWGNMSVYPLSYQLVRVHHTAGLQTPWVIPINTCFVTLGFILAGYVSQRGGKLVSLLGGVAVFLAGIALTFFSVKSSLAFMNFTVGAMVGLGCGIINGMAQEYGAAKATDDPGLVASVIQSGLNSGPIVINGLVTWYTNPDNEAPDKMVGHLLFFTQDSILDSVPSLFLVLGALFLGILAIGVLLVRFTENDTEETKTLNPRLPDGSEKRYVETHFNSEATADVDNAFQEMDWKQMIKTSHFYVLWTICFFTLYSIGVIFNYYKSYGQLWIEDDHLLALCGTIALVSAVIFGSLWGAASDYIGINMSLVLTNAVSSVGSLLIFFAPMLTRGMYLAAVALYASSCCCVYSLLLAATSIMFGKKHLSRNFGFVLSGGLVIAVAPFLMEWILTELGWFYTFLLPAVLHAASVILTVVALPRC